MKKLLFALLVLLSRPSFAFEDPSGALPKLDGLLGAANFAQAFRSGDRVELQRKSCTGTACGTLRAHYDVVNASSATAEVTTTIEGRAQPHRVATITRQQWQEINGNRARDVIREVESYGQRVVIASLRETSVTLLINGRPTPGPAFELEFTAQGQIGGPSKQTLTLSQLCRGPGQIVLRTVDDGIAGSSVTELLSCQLTP